MTGMNTIPILYNGGSYGTFLEWCLFYFAGYDIVSDPTGLNGNSHGYDGTQLVDIHGWETFVKNQKERPKFIRFHPKIKETESITETIEKLLLSAEKIILLYPDKDSLLLTINNKFEKIWPQGWLTKCSDMFRHNLIGWNASDLNDMKPWEIREFLSFFIITQHKSEVDFDVVTNFSHPQVKKIDIRNLFHNFETTIRSVLDWAGLEVERNNFDFVHKRWLSSQKHADKDFLANIIIKAVVENQQMDWSDANLTIADEAYIQMQLRDQYGLELMCFEMNIFPTNVSDLRNRLLLNNR